MSEAYTLFIEEMKPYLDNLGGRNSNITIMRDRIQRGDFTTAKRLIDEYYESGLKIYVKMRDFQSKVRDEKHTFNEENYLELMGSINLAIDSHAMILEHLVNLGLVVRRSQQNAQERSK